ncbi:polysaccharide biosynthesis/export family protein [Rhodonellum sp.]|uniref:polysaccharide biosynthesis/export family protein n=1 Tax=Rhodonellum sp. TaxID=2231180 RepID=UPI002719E868|nr:polysaccharide biosynthesis/export family protein [Rhodonellum sp.]MDO9554611.1 polysaccharide biosynthesis/export family protein [Rhodonellum sp.]
MSDLEFDKTFQAEINDQGIVKIQAGDLLRISLSSLQPEMNTMFNNPSPDLDFNRNIINNINAEGFLVNEKGEVNIPVVGKIKLQGLTKSEATEAIEKGIGEYIVDPVVTVRFANFKVTVIGEVNNPSTFYVPSEKLSIFEALGLAGDMTEFGLRENVLLIRESEGVRSAVRIDFNDKNLLKSPYYNLKQNDLIYVQPDKMKSVKASTNERSMIFAGLAVSLLVPILFNWQNIFQY